MRVQLIRRIGERRRRERGATAIIVAMMTLVLLGLTAFAVDIAMAFANVRSVQNGADAAALAVARHIADEVEDETCDEIAAAFTDAASSQSLADKYFKDNVPAAELASPTASIGDIGVECKSVYSAKADDYIEQVVVYAPGYQASPVIFGGAVGATDGKIEINRDARAIVGPAGSVMGLRPFAICETDALALEGDPDSLRILAFTNNWTEDGDAPEDATCGGAAGNWGLLDLSGSGGGTGSEKQCDTFDKAVESLVCWILDGYPAAITDPTSLPSETGSFGGLGPEIQTILDQEIAVPVFDTIEDPFGSNAKYNVVRFIGIKLCAIDVQGGVKKEGVCADDPWDDREDLYPDMPKGSTNYLQVQYTRLITVGELGSCSFGDSDCNDGVRVVKLAD